MLQVAKAASQTDEAETQLVRLQAEFESYKVAHKLVHKVLHTG